MNVFMSWARSTVAQRRALPGSYRPDYFDRMLIGVLVLLAFAIAFLFFVAM